ncbi:kinase-like protein [Thelephora ganbajun]|uniref:Kinase-like protein n=1 Tax=Thelephora ganbajun TaxID=370292 RepID=A0ACB6Z7F2_THEGA|nr:kinase-like protein [Thelephora ganbajun]
MDSPSSSALQRLHYLDTSSPDFYDQLGKVLYGQEYVQCVPNLMNDDLVWLVDYLDKALDRLDLSSPVSRKCLRELRNICGTSAILPTPYTLSNELLDIGPNPFASGGFGDVYHGTLNGLRVCVKRVRVYTRDGPQKVAKAFCKEAVMWKRLDHPNVLPLLGVTIAPFQLISSWMSGGNLPEYIERHADADRIRLLCDVAEGLKYLHSCNVIHGDLKGPNVLVDNSGYARIADFGFATVTQNPDSIPSISCHNGHTPRWTAPEVLNEGPHSKEADVFAFAMVMIEVFTGAVPFGDGPSSMAMLSIMQGERPSRPTHPAFTENLWSLMRRCWDQDPRSRPKVSEALKILLSPNIPPWKRLITQAPPTNECISLITAIFSDRGQVEVVKNLTGNDVRIFIDVIDKVLDSLTPQTRKECLPIVYDICDRQAVVPRPLAIPLCYDETEVPVCSGDVAEVWKGQHHGREVAAKVLRLSRGHSRHGMKRAFCRGVVVWRALRHPNVLPLLGVTMTKECVVTVSEWMKNGNINEFVEANTDADRLGLLRGVTNGLMYLHDQGIIHGNLRGANILINDNGCACLSGFSLSTMAVNQSFTGLSDIIRWMSPEVFLFGKSSTKESDCYTLGMVIYEVLSGQVPFAAVRSSHLVSHELFNRRHPSRPQGMEGAWFTDGLWEMLERCWRDRPSDRPGLDVVLQCLECATRPSKLTPDVDEDLGTDTDDHSDDIASVAGSQWSVDRVTRKIRKAFKLPQENPLSFGKLDGSLRRTWKLSRT